MSNYSALGAPNILKETSSGLAIYSIEDEMLMNREIQCVGEITRDKVYSLIMQLQHLQKADPDSEITMYINSPGGEVVSGLALYDVMQAISSPIRTVCIGTAASMGSILFAAGEKREILPHAKVMIHDPLISGGIGGSALEIQTISDNLMKTRQITAEVLAKHCGKTVEEIYEKTKSDCYFSADEAVAFGLADTVIETL